MAVLRNVTSDCDDGFTCPAVYVDNEETETVVVQGSTEPPGQALPNGETRVRIPRAVLLKAAKELG
jgi:hypothetical protein